MGARATLGPRGRNLAAEVGELRTLIAGLSASKVNKNSTEVLTSSVAVPSPVLDPAIGVSILLNPGGGPTQVFVLPDGQDGQVKEIVNGANGTVATSFITVHSTNNLGNDQIDLNPNTSIRLAWVTALGGWVATSCCLAVDDLWD